MVSNFRISIFKASFFYQTFSICKEIPGSFTKKSKWECNCIGGFEILSTKILEER